MARRFVISAAALVCVFAVALFALPAFAGPTINVDDEWEALHPVFQSDPVGAIKSTRELIAAGKMDRAIKHLETYVAAHPFEPAPRRFLGDLYFRTGQLDRAKFQYQLLLRQNPGDKETHNRLGTVLAVENHVDDAIAQFNAALPGTESVDDLVSLHQRKGDLPAYERDVERMSHLYPTDPGIQGEVGQVYNAIHQPYAASVHFRRALDEDPTNLTALNGLGLALMTMYDFAGAVKQFKACLKIDPTAFQCENNMAASYLESKQLGEAEIALDRAYQLAPERAETFVNRGYLADMQGDWKTAAAFYAQAIQMYPYLRESYIDLALAYEDHKMYALAQAALIKGLAAVPDDGRLHFLLGKAYEAQGDHTEAVAQFKLAAAGTDPDASRIARTMYALDTSVPTPEKSK
ncbi:MAG TPA: tetratricopeptide repeat protein [Candidatus Aquilonibacter sp.]|nr:tetratricopeptide repeat protein [Candidatus Aquilonibacter sp.]